MFGPSLFNPWVLLSLAAAFLVVAFTAREEGVTSATSKVTAAWEQANREATQARQVRIDANKKVMQDAQAARDNERKKDAATLERMRGNLLIALNGLRDRPTRASDGIDQSGAGASSPRPAQRSTGAGLYGDDAVFLTWKADAAQRIRMQRDACYRAYGQAQAAVSRVQCQ